MIPALPTSRKHNQMRIDHLVRVVEIWKKRCMDARRERDALKDAIRTGKAKPTTPEGYEKLSTAEQYRRLLIKAAARWEPRA